ncbi:comF family protein [Rhodoblastus acidophilus]|uniref:ComF family protein n=1 Tax=Rhodoblastus acidophilus TaxID=1074 RepID=A0A212RYN3_RHOAC|nr:ComF family protein [Rhodoblastus acidophilus]PPQ36413.1 amidophosphoribosyltransferase [Rhodoblastus acidophilus]RAI17659.1 amidophosphoribosyltransferase [Rhodoblastus acidophilus]SNB77863.1 comF family protein [Rhodoblastus acidophilus]
MSLGPRLLLASGLGAIKRAGALALDLLYPPACLACRRAIAAHGGLCADCWRAVRFIERPYCERLGAPFEASFGAEDGERAISPEAQADPPVFARLRAVACFDEGPVRTLVHRLKYGDRLELAGPMGRWMARAGAELLDEADLLIPVPLHASRLAHRRFNQSVLLAREISRCSGVPLRTGLLMRVKPTPPQVGLSRRLRALNMQGAFAAPPDKKGELAHRRLVLVDDVATSGSTLNAAARALLRAGAERVDALAFARVVTETRNESI